MTNILFGFPNYIDPTVTETPTVSGGSWQASLPLTNLQDRRLSRVARSTNVLVTSTTFSVSLGGTNRNIKVVAIPKHTISFAGTIRVRLINGNIGLPAYLDFSTGWTLIGAPTRTPANITGADGIIFDLISDTSAVALQGYSRVLPNLGTTGQVKAFSFKVIKGTSTSSVVRVRDTTAGADRLLLAITWSGSVPTVTMTTGTLTVVTALGSGEYRVSVLTTACTTANAHQLEVYPATTAALAIANTGDINMGDFEVYGVTQDRLVADSGYVSPWPAGLTAEDLAGMNVSFVYIPVEGVFTWPVGQGVRTVIVDIVDTTNAAGFIDLSRLVLAGGFQPTINMAYGSGIGLDTKTVRDETDGGAAQYDERPVRRLVSGVLEEMPEAEAMNNYFRMGIQAGISKQVFVCWDPADTTYRYLRSFLAVLGKPNALEQPYFARFKGAFQCIEEL